MFNRLATQTAALALAAFATLVLLGSVESIAARETQQAVAEATPAQQVVIVGQRLPRA
jgi:hypothetical protein